MTHDGRADFDFFIGRWSVAHRRLARRLADCDDWIAFDGTCVTRHILQGQGNMDDNIVNLPGDPYAAVSTRLYDPGTGLWSVYSIDARSLTIDPPVRGRFEAGAGTFLGEDVLEGRPIRVRFLWSDITPLTARWSQAFSPDGGDSWETNWIMDFTRAA
ncbi:MAG: DUF1579 domain-containing protein [Caulobacter sp.]|nr:DUF1579 domain-containing protein [Caulobacter sp.]